jgi:hypothetical protein
MTGLPPREVRLLTVAEIAAYREFAEQDAARSRMAGYRRRR